MKITGRIIVLLMWLIYSVITLSVFTCIFLVPLYYVLTGRNIVMDCFELSKMWESVIQDVRRVFDLDTWNE